MLNTGLSEIDAVSELRDSSDNPYIKSLMKKVEIRMRDNSQLGTALFDALKIRRTSTRELFGDAQLGTILPEIFNYISNASLRKTQWHEVKGALIGYQWFYLIMIFLVVTLFSISVFPHFEDLFHGFGAELPSLTVFLIQFTEWFVANTGGF